MFYTVLIFKKFKVLLFTDNNVYKLRYWLQHHINECFPGNNSTQTMSNLKGIHEYIYLFTKEFRIQNLRITFNV